MIPAREAEGGRDAGASAVGQSGHLVAGAVYGCSRRLFARDRPGPEAIRASGTRVCNLGLRPAMEPSSALRTAASTAVLLVFSAAAQPVVAQQTSSIIGTVLDQTTLLPIAGGIVSLVDYGVEVTADEGGNFRFESIPPGSVTLRAGADRYSSAVDKVEVTPGEISVVQVHLLPVDLLLQEILVRAGRGPREANVVVNDEQGSTALSAADLLEREIPGLTIGRSGNVGADASMLIRGVNTIQGNPQPAVYLDGVRISGGAGGSGGIPRLGVLKDIPANQIKRIRVLKGASAAAQFADSANGVILIETIRGSRD